MSTAETHESTHEKPVERALLAGSVQRSEIFRKHFSGLCAVAENLIYEWMDRLCEDYHGGYWNIYELSNGGFYMAPKTDARFEVCCFGFGDSVRLSADGAGLVATLFAVNQLANSAGEDHIIELYYLIRDYVFGHDEAGKIFRAID
jgi:hypothetical protein